MKRLYAVAVSCAVLSGHIPALADNHGPVSLNPQLIAWVTQVATPCVRGGTPFSDETFVDKTRGEFTRVLQQQYRAVHEAGRPVYPYPGHPILAPAIYDGQQRLAAVTVPTSDGDGETDAIAEADPPPKALAVTRSLGRLQNARVAGINVGMASSYALRLLPHMPKADIGLGCGSMLIAIRLRRTRVRIASQKSISLVGIDERVVKGIYYFVGC